MRDELASISINSIAHDYYNIASIIETVDFLKDKPGSEISPEGARAKLVVKFSLSVIRFLQWFESLNVNSNCLEVGV